MYIHNNKGGWHSQLYVKVPINDEVVDLEYVCEYVPYQYMRGMLQIVVDTHLIVVEISSSIPVEFGSF